MYGFTQEIEDELENIRFLINELETRGCEMPDGALVYKKINGQFYYYRQYYDGNIKKSEYLGKYNDEKVLKFKAVKFNALRLKVLKQDLALLMNLREKYVRYEPAEIHRRLPSSYKDLPDECYVDDKFERLCDWAAEDYESSSFPFASTGCTTIDGTKVRSKGECIWYDTLYRYAVPFRYEETLELRDETGRKVAVHPDFSIMCYNERVIYIEHAGMLLKPSYMEDFKWKITTYLRNNIVMGDNLFVTSDNKDSGINSQMIDLFVKNMIKPLVFGNKT